MYKLLVISALLRGVASLFLCKAPPHSRQILDLGRYADESEIVLTGKVLRIESQDSGYLIVRAVIEIDCVYKTNRADLQGVVRVDGVTTQLRSCFSVVKLFNRYLFFLITTYDDSLFNVQHMQQGAIQLRKHTDLSSVLEVAYQASQKPTGHMCYQNCVEVSEWSEWSTCEAPCGKSIMKRNLLPPSGVRKRKRNYECSVIEEHALCEVCPCNEPARPRDTLHVLEKETHTYFVHGGCQSTEVVKNKWCVGLCRSANSINLPVRIGVETVRMICSDGSVVFWNVAIILECGCVEQAFNEESFFEDMFGFK